MASVNVNRVNQLFRSGNVLVAMFLVGTALIQWLRPVDSCAVCSIAREPAQEWQAEADLELIRARERFEMAEKHFASVKHLNRNGSVSKRALRIAGLERNVALLEYSSVLDPGQRARNRLLQAEVLLKFHQRERAIMKELYARGSISESSYRRSVAAHEVAAANLKSVQSDTPAKRRLEAVKAAQAKLKVAQGEYATAKRLFQSRAISQTALNQATSKLTIAKAELKSAKQTLGARAVQLRQ